jgi:hypothetical protein
LNRLLTKDFVSGLLFIGGGVAALALALDVVDSSPSLMRSTAVILMGLGGLFCAAGAIGQQHLPAWPSVGMISIGILCFALLLERGGIAPALVALILVSSMGLEDFLPGEIVANAVVIAVMGALVAPAFA